MQKITEGLVLAAGVPFGKEETMHSEIEAIEHVQQESAVCGDAACRNLLHNYSYNTDFSKWTNQEEDSGKENANGSGSKKEGKA